MVQQKEQEGLTCLGRESVDVIQDQDGVVLEHALKVVEEADQNPFMLGGLPGPLGLSSDIQVRIDARQSSDERGEEARRVVLSLLAGKPGHRSRARGSPFGQQGGLARASRSRDQRHRSSQALLQECEQARACHMLHGQARGSDATLEDHGRREFLRCEGNVHKRRRALVCLQASHVLSIYRQAAGRLPQVREREIGGDAQVTAREPSTLAPIGSPVPSTTPIARPRFVRRKGSLLADKGEGSGRFQPSVPG